MGVVKETFVWVGRDWEAPFWCVIMQFERPDIDRIFAVAVLMEPFAQRKRVTKVLDGAILGNMFFEASTRTRISFGCAFNLLGGEVRETTGIENSALAKNWLDQENFTNHFFLIKGSRGIQMEKMIALD